MKSATIYLHEKNSDLVELFHFLRRNILQTQTSSFKIAFLILGKKTLIRKYAALNFDILLANLYEHDKTQSLKLEG